MRLGSWSVCVTSDVDVTYDLSTAAAGQWGGSWAAAAATAAAGRSAAAAVGQDRRLGRHPALHVAPDRGRGRRPDSVSVDRTCCHRVGGGDTLPVYVLLSC